MANEVYSVAISGLLEGQFVQNVLHCQLDNLDGDNDFLVAKSIAAELFPAAPGGLGMLYRDALPIGWIGSACRVRRVGPTGGNSAVTTLDPATYVGGRTGDSVPMTSGPLVVLVGTDPSNATGRIFLPGLSEDDCIEGRVSDAEITAINFLIDDLVAGFQVTPGVTTYDAVWGIYDRVNNTFDTLLGAYVSPKIGTQRRRYIPMG